MDGLVQAGLAAVGAVESKPVKPYVLRLIQAIAKMPLSTL